MITVDAVVGIVLFIGMVVSVVICRLLFVGCIRLGHWLGKIVDRYSKV